MAIKTIVFNAFIFFTDMKGLGLFIVVDDDPRLGLLKGAVEKGVTV